MKPRIAFVRDSMNKIDGTRRAFINVVNSLSSMCDVYIVNRYRNQPVYAISDKVKGIYFLNDIERKLRYSLVSDIFRLRKFLKENQIDVVVASARSCPIRVSLACIGLRTKAVMREHNCIYGLDLETKRRKRIYQHLLDWYLNHGFDKTVVLTKAEVSRYQKRYPQAAGVDFIYNHMDERLISDRTSYDVESHKIITAGRIDYQKGYEYLIEVAKRVLESHPDWSWDIYGDGDAAYTEKISSLIEKSGLSGRLVMRGNSNRIYDLYPNYGLYVMTSRYEGLPMVLLEAKAKRLPLVSFDIYSGPSDIILDGVNGYLVKPFDVDAMTEKISFLIDHPEVRQDFSDHAYDNIDHFRKEAVMAKWTNLIKELLKLRGGKAFLVGYLAGAGGAVC